MDLGCLQALWVEIFCTQMTYFLLVTRTVLLHFGGSVQEAAFDAFIPYIQLYYLKMSANW
ncbi:unnamed protein product [Schistosoma curassoni]|uniref:Bestrophin homolog n=1 Tax=Schistosoma curassoni TaxID=6186 RepID=A0A183JT59_9TREM|nr:unnamed protein product [Schistosoma curassoni]